MPALDLARRLISIDSTSRRSNVEISELLEATLGDLGFETERVDYRDPAGVEKANVVARRGEGTGGIAYFGHTDVVPATAWRGPGGPFEPAVEDGRLHGRGSCDMKGSIACFLAAVGRVGGPDAAGPIHVVLTADEEVGFLGAREVRRRSRIYRDLVAGRGRGIVGEPTGLEVIHAHKGIVVFRATSRGVAAHSGTDRGRNANLAMIPFLVEMKAIHDETEGDPAWRDPAFDPPGLGWNIGINDHTPAVNITPAASVATVCFRPMPGQDPSILVERARRRAAELGLEFEVTVDAAPFGRDPASPHVRQALDLTGRDDSRTVCYGTDAGIFDDLPDLIVLGPGDIALAHTDRESIGLDELRSGTEVYERAIRACR